MVASGSNDSTAAIFIKADSPARWNHGVYSNAGNLRANFFTLANTVTATDSFCVDNAGRTGVGLSDMSGEPTGVRLCVKNSGDTRIRIEGSGSGKDVCLQLTDVDYNSWWVNNLDGQFNIAVGATSTTHVVLSLDKDTYAAAFLGTVSSTGLKVAEGSNAKQGTATLVAGTVTVSNTSVTANSRIFLTIQSLGTVTAPKAIGVTARVAGTSFTITSADNTDTSVVAYEIFEPSA